MDIEELVIKIRATAEGVKQGVDLAKKQLKELEDAQDKLSDDLSLIDLEKAKAANKELIEGIKARYKEEIEAAKEAADAEIAIYEGRIRDIDALLKQESRKDLDNSQLDKIRRLNEQLLFETDDSNKYELQKEIANLQAEFEKRKRRESLEDEKALLKDEILAVKDNLAEKQKALIEARDEEIRLQNQAFDIYVAIVKERKETDIKAANEKRALMEANTNEILTDLAGHLGDFSILGQQAGEAFAEAYRMVIMDLMAELEEFSGSSGVSAHGGNSGGTNNINVQNNFSMPVATPSKVAAATKNSLEMATRYGY